MNDRELLTLQLKRLGLHTMALIFEPEAAKAAKAEMTYTSFLARLVNEELAAKTDRSVAARIAKAHLPMMRTLEEFDFSFQPCLPAARLRELAELGFLAKAENIILVGHPGVGKTHLAIALAVRACQSRKRVLFAHAPELLDQLLAAEVSRSLGKLLEVMRKLDLLVVDELGYLPMDPHRANLCFQLVSQMYTHTSVIVTTNVTFNDWGKIFGDEVIAAAILDRLLHFSHAFQITGPSYRIKDKLPPLLEKPPRLCQDTSRNPTHNPAGAQHSLVPSERE